MNLVILLDDNNDIYGSTVFLKNIHLINPRAEELKLLTPPFFLKLYRFCLSYISGKSGDINNVCLSLELGTLISIYIYIKIFNFYFTSR